MRFGEQDSAILGDSLRSVCEPRHNLTLVGIWFYRHKAVIGSLGLPTRARAMPTLRRIPPDSKLRDNCFASIC
jgi:hypothetical protein